MACRASQGCTGVVAILSDGDGMHLMPFAQAATMTGDATTITGPRAPFAQFGR